MTIRAGPNASSKIEGVMADRRISHKCKGNVLSSCISSANMNALETMALTEKQQETVQICEEKNPGKNNRGS